MENPAPQQALAMPHPQEAAIRSDNADRLARRKAAAALAGSLGDVSGNSLNRRNTRRQIGGVYETMQAVPARQVPQNFALSKSELEQFLKSFNFGAATTIIRGGSTS